MVAYDRAHRRERERWKAMLAKGSLNCCRCGGVVTSAMRWELDHTDDESGYLGVSHRSCNARAGQAKGQRNVRSALPWLKGSGSW